MKQTISLILLLVTLIGCAQENNNPPTQEQQNSPSEQTKLSETEEHYRSFEQRTGESHSKGTVENGTLENGRIFPFSGENFHYFDTTSYLANRCFVHEKVRDCVLSTYKTLETTTPRREFGLMECSNEHGGKIAPHRTHQNGLSVDFMTPLLKNGQPYTELDYMGGQHYLMNFDSEGRYEEDPEVTIDFELMAQHLLILIEEARENGLSVKKIIWKMELQNELFATPSGKKLQQTVVTTKGWLSCQP